ncbi:MAG: penicillin-insensitive murein endopeptidase [Minicystis sp.]
MPKPVRLALVLLALAGVQALTTEAAARPHARPHGRRAKIDAVSSRAPRASTFVAAAKRPEPAPKKPQIKADSIGSPNEGHLEGGVRLDLTRPYFRVVPSYESGDVRWALPVMNAMIDRAARTVARRFPGAVLDVGDLSKRGGGDLLRHHSHESGRDADLGFYAVDAKGKQLHGHGFIKFEGPAVSPNTPGAHFDAPRNWLFVEQLLTDPAARVSHIFIAEPLRQHLLAYARAHGTSRALLDRAAVVMMQPTTSLPHDDHIHVRISCPASMHGSCIELAKNAPHGKRLAHKGGGLKTPGKGRPVVARPVTRPGAVGGDPKKVVPPAAAGIAPQEGFTLDLTGDEGEGDADAAEVKDLVDETGSVKITD